MKAGLQLVERGLCVINSKVRQQFQLKPGRQEWVTVVECICGSVVPPLVISKQKTFQLNGFRRAFMTTGGLTVISKAGKAMSMVWIDLSDALNPKHARRQQRNIVFSIQKVEWLMAFVVAHDKAVCNKNTLGGFRGTGIHPFLPTKVLRRLASSQPL